MRKVFNEDDLAVDGMEAPCRCNCGRWFDLDDGFPKKGSNDVICEVCYEEQELEDESEKTCPVCKNYFCICDEDWEEE